MGLGLLLVAAECGERRESGVRAFTPTTPATHTSFPISSGPHAVDCSACHESFATFKQFSCLGGCHAEQETTANHQGVSGYAYDSAACYRCHERAGAEALDHSPFFPIAAGDRHGSATCGDCHRSEDRSVVSCATASCHAAVATTAQHAQVSGYEWESAACLRCHAEAQVVPVSGHLAFGIAGGFAHAGIPCVQCHVEPRADKSYATDFSRFSCTSGTCHPQAAADAQHAGVAAYAYASAQCHACHPQGTRLGGDHTAYFPIGTGARHAALSCADCHREPDQTRVTCAAEGCHGTATMSAAHGSVGGYEWSSPSCLRCHADGQVRPVAAHAPFNIAAGAAHHLLSCLVCHPQPRVDKPFGADFARFSCTGAGCHAQASTDSLHAPVTDYVYDSDRCFACHPHGVRESAVDHTALFPIGPADAHGAIPCADCHHSQDRTVVTCAAEGCHGASTMAAAHTQVNGYTWTSSLCLRCHAEAQVSRVSGHLPFGVISGYPHRLRPCLVCHPSLRADKPFATDFGRFTCDGSGCHSQASMQSTHNGIGGYAWNPPTCVRSGCHPDGRRP